MKIKHDVHNHSFLSSCAYDEKATAENFVKKAAELGHKTFGISNHMWDAKVPGGSKWYKHQFVEFVLEIKAALPKDTQGVKILIGTETEYYGKDDILGISVENAEKFDYILIPHSHMHMRGYTIEQNDDVLKAREVLYKAIKEVIPGVSDGTLLEMAERVSPGQWDSAIKNPTVDIIQYAADFMVKSFTSLMHNEALNQIVKFRPISVAHAFFPCGYDNDNRIKIINRIGDEEYRKCFELAKEKGVGIEINTGSFCNPADNYANEPLIRVFKIAKDVGCKFTFGTDAHSVAGLDGIRKGDELSEIIGITEDDLMDFVK